MPVTDQDINELARLYNMLQGDLPDGMGFGDFLDDFEEFCFMTEP